MCPGKTLRFVGGGTAVLYKDYCLPDDLKGENGKIQLRRKYYVGRKRVSTYKPTMKIHAQLHSMISIIAVRKTVCCCYEVRGSL